jgi:hypothetical protein
MDRENRGVYTAMKVLRQCPLVLVLKAGEYKTSGEKNVDI